ncbi:enoyl-CoA hydratase/isomerase family protein [Streptomyces sp. NPDC004726]
MGHVSTITLRNGRLNVLNRAMQEEFLSACEELDGSPSTRVVLVRGAGEHFAAGADVEEMVALSVSEVAQAADRISRCLGALASVGKPTIALIDGFALGGGLEIALAADRRIATESARVGLPEILLGVIPGGGGTQRLAEIVGRSAAKDLIWTGRILEAAEAHGLGVLDELVPDAEALDERGRTYAAALASGPTRAIAAAKNAVDGGGTVITESGLANETRLFTALFETDDQRIGMRSFLENGPGRAAFTGA